MEHEENSELNIQELLDLIGEETPAPSAQTLELSDPNPPEEPAPEVSPKKKKRPGRELMLYLHDMAYLLCGIVLAFLLLFRVVIVSGNSMNKTLIDGDYLLLISSNFYQNPQQGDIIVASKADFRDGDPIVKRVIATEGQLVDIDFATGTVYVDGVALEESYISSETTRYEGISFPLTVEENHLFVMGDNRMDSKDSRDPDIGQIDKREVLGKAIFLMVPGTNGGYDKFDLSRIGGLW